MLKNWFLSLLSFVLLLAISFIPLDFSYASGVNVGGNGNGAAGSSGSYFKWEQVKSGSGDPTKDEPTSLSKGDRCPHSSDQSTSLTEESVALISLRHNVDGCDGNQWVGHSDNGETLIQGYYLDAAGNYAPYDASSINPYIMNEKYSNFKGNIDVCYDNEHEGVSGNFYEQSKFWLKIDGKPVTAAWIADYPIVVVDKDDTKLIIELVQEYDDPSAPDPKPSNTPVDDRNKKEDGDHNKWLYNYGVEDDVPYGDRTEPDEFNYKYKIHVVVKQIHYVKVHKEWAISGKKISNTTVETWTCEKVNKYDKTFKYSVNTPEISQEKYRPVFLNPKRFVESGDPLLDTDNDIDSFVSASTKLDIKANQPTHAGEASKEGITTLDINADTPFTLSLGEKLGMPTKYEWDNAVNELCHGSWEYVGEDVVGEGGYCNGKMSNADSDKLIRTNLALHCSISDIKTGLNTASLYHNPLDGSYEKKQEYLSGEEYKQRYKKDSSQLDPGSWSARFSLAGDYTTDNEISNTKYKNWWVNDYNVTKFYEYGIEYSGVVTIDGIENPRLADDIECDYVDEGSSGVFYTDTEKEQRSLYVGKVSKHFEQPVMYALWSVKTLAGDVIGD